MEIKRREYGTGTDRRSVHFELWLDGRRLPTATAVVEEGGVTVNWSALGDVPPRLALDFAQGLAALTAAVNQEDSGRPVEYRGPCAHTAYRRYYLACKMADRCGRPQRWRRQPPSWMADRVERAGSHWAASGRPQEARGAAEEYRGSGRARTRRLEPPARVLAAP